MRSHFTANRGIQCLNWVVAILVVVGGSAVLWGQSSQSFVGTVKDDTGGVIPGVEVTARHLATDQTRTVVTNDTGDYLIAQLTNIGAYEIRAQMAGFKAAVAQNVLLETGSTVRVDLTLEVGAVAEVVTVSAGTQLVRSETSSLEIIVKAREITELPLFGRNFLDLTKTTAGVSTRAPAAMGYQETNLVVGAARARDNEYSIDGIRSMDDHNADMAVKPPLDSIAEFELVRNLYAAEHGRAMGAIVNVRTKSGSNDFHGSVYWFSRRGDWAAIPYFAASKPVYEQDDYGGSIGGPVRLPGLYDGTGRTFFFYNFEKFRSPSEAVKRGYMLDDAELAGDFSQSPWGLPVDPYSKVPYANGVIPSSQFSTATQNMLQILPRPNEGFDGAYNYNGNFDASTFEPKHVIRIDHSFSDDFSIFSSTMWTTRSGVVAPAIDCGAGCERASDLSNNTDNVNSVLGGSWSITPEVIWEGRAGYVFHKGGYAQTNRSENYAKNFGMAFHPSDEDTHLHGVPRVNVRGFGSYFGLWATPFNERMAYNYQVSNSISVNRGNHFVKIGADLLQDRHRAIGACGSTGQYWLGWGTDNGTTNQAADFLIGDYNFAGFQFTPQWRKSKRWRTSYFIQDDWKVDPRLTVNIGLRHDWFAPFGPIGNARMARYDLVTDEVIYPADAQEQMTPDERSALLFPHRFDGPAQTFFDEDKGSFGPRLGIAFRPFGTGNMVVRAGYGIFYGSPQGYAVNRNSSSVAPWQAWLNLGAFGSTGGRVFLWDELQSEVSTLQYLAVGNIRMPENGFHNPYMQHWNLTIQKELPGGMAAEVGYIGSRGVHLEFEHQGRKFASLYGYEDFGLGGGLRISTSGHDSKYHAIQMTLERRFAAGLAFRTNYTLGNLQNDTPEHFDTTVGSHVSVQKHEEWGRGQGHMTHIVNLSGIYELPFGRQRYWGGNWNRVADTVLGGWKVNFLLDANSGAPVNVLWGGVLRPDWAPNKGPDRLPKPSRQRWVDPTHFTAQSGPRQGNVGRNIIDGPNFINLDFGISKLFGIPGTETHTMEVRVEIANATNHPNLFFPSQRIDVSQPGTVTLRNAYPMRRIQWGLRYAF